MASNIANAAAVEQSKPRYSQDRQLMNWTSDNRERLIAATHVFIRETGLFIPCAQFVSKSIGCTQGAAQQFFEKQARKWIVNGVCKPPTDVNKRKKGPEPEPIQLANLTSIMEKHGCKIVDGVVVKDDKPKPKYTRLEPVKDGNPTPNTAKPDKPLTTGASHAPVSHSLFNKRLASVVGKAPGQIITHVPNALLTEPFVCNPLKVGLKRPASTSFNIDVLSDGKKQARSNKVQPIVIPDTRPSAKFQVAGSPDGLPMSQLLGQFDKNQHNRMQGFQEEMHLFSKEQNANPLRNKNIIPSVSSIDPASDFTSATTAYGLALGYNPNSYFATSTFHNSQQVQVEPNFESILLDSPTIHGFSSPFSTQLNLDGNDLPNFGNAIVDVQKLQSASEIDKNGANARITPATAATETLQPNPLDDELINMSTFARQVPQTFEYDEEDYSTFVDLGDDPIEDDEDPFVGFDEVIYDPNQAQGASGVIGSTNTTGTTDITESNVKDNAGSNEGEIAETPSGTEIERPVEETTTSQWEMFPMDDIIDFDSPEFSAFYA